MKLAFRKTNAPGFFAGLFNRYTRWSLKTNYSHGGLLIGEHLWHTTTQGFIPEPFNSSEAWDLFQTPISDRIALSRVSGYKGIRYDAYSLLGFKLPFKFSDRNGLNCFEGQWLGLTGENPTTQISPDFLMAKLLRMLNEKCTEANNASDVDNGTNGKSNYSNGG